MKASELKKGTKVWCWWLSRTLYYTGKMHRGTEYTFEDVIGAQFDFNDEQVAKLKRA